MSGAHIADARCYWPAGLAELSPAERAAALERGWWRDGDHIVTREGQRFLVDELDDELGNVWHDEQVLARRRELLLDASRANPRR